MAIASMFRPKPKVIALLVVFALAVISLLELEHIRAFGSHTQSVVSSWFSMSPTGSYTFPSSNADC